MHIAQWQNFYVIVGTAAGALTGLMFVVIALTREMMASAPRTGLRSFVTPTIVHFASVLGISAMLSMPRLTYTSTGWILVLSGATLLAYMTWIIRTARRLDYNSDLEDTIFHFTLPPIVHATILVAGLMEWSKHDWAMYLVAGSLLVLLIIGIHNAWDSAVWMVTRTTEPS